MLQGERPQHATDADDAANESQNTADPARMMTRVSDSARYTRGEFLGQGGMARVVLGRDLRLGRDVALKEVPPGLDPAFGARLAREAAIAARLDHPGIIPVHDAGRHPDGTMFFAMRVVRGRSLAELARDADVPRERLFRAVLAAAEALGWAHAMGVVHRDVKPANIMVGEFGETQVVDWGLARDGVPLSSPPSSPAAPLPLPPSHPVSGRTNEALTRVGTVIGTPQFMAPEQAQGHPADARSDVWSLGAVLFDLVAGRPPHVGSTQDDVLVSAAWRRQPRVVELVPDLQPELAAIIEKALSREPADRYPHGKALADDLARYLDGRRVHAYAYSQTDLLKRAFKAWRLPIMVSVAALIAVIIAVAMAFAATRSGRERAEAAEFAARTAAAQAQAAVAETRIALLRADRNLGRALANQAMSQSADARAETEVLAVNALMFAESALARGLLVAWGAAPRPQRLTDMPLPAECPHPLVGTDGRIGCRKAISLPLRHLGKMRQASWNAAYLKVVGTATEWMGLPCGMNVVGGIAIDERASTWTALCLDGRIEQGRLDVPPENRARDAEVVRLDEPLPVSAAAIVPGSDLVLIGTTKGEVALVDTRDGRIAKRAVLTSGSVLDIDVSRDGTLAALIGDRGGVVIWDLAREATPTRLPTLWARGLRFSDSDARMLWTIGPTVRSWRVPETRPAMLDAPGGVTSLSIRDGLLAATTGRGVLMFETGKRALKWSADWPAGTVKSGAFLDGPIFFAANAGSTEIKAWRALTGEALEALTDGENGRARRVGALTTVDGTVVLTIPYEPRAVALRPDGVQTIATGSFMDLALSSDARAAVLLREEPREACRLDALPYGGELVDMMCHAAEGVVAVAVSPDHTRVFGARAMEVVAWERNGDISVRFATDGRAGGHLTDVEISPDGQLLAAGDSDGTTWLWRVSDAHLLARIIDHRERVTALVFDGSKYLYTGSWDGTIRIRDLGLLDVPASQMKQTIEGAWGLALDDVVTGAGR